MAAAWSEGDAVDAFDCTGVWREAILRSVVAGGDGAVLSFIAWADIFDETLTSAAELAERVAEPYTHVDNWRPLLVAKDRVEYRRDDALWYWARVVSVEADELTLTLDCEDGKDGAVKIVVPRTAEMLARAGTHKRAPVATIAATAGYSGIVGGGAYSARASSTADLAEYRAGYPTTIASLNDASLRANVLFQRGEAPATQPESFAIADFHAPHGKWARDYAKLESMHCYIQWLFPISEKSPFNAHSQILQRHEIVTIAADSAAMANVRKSLDTMLHFFGMRIVASEGGPAEEAPAGGAAVAIERLPQEWEERYANLNLMAHNYLRITRVCKFLGELRLDAIVEAWVAFFIDEVLGSGRLPGTRNSLTTYWVQVSVLFFIFTVTFRANPTHKLTHSLAPPHNQVCP